MKTFELNGKTYVLNGNKAVEVKVKESKPLKNPLDFWTKTMKAVVKQTGLSYKSKNGKIYPAVKAVLPDKREVLLKQVKGGSIYTMKDF